MLGRKATRNLAAYSCRQWYAIDSFSCSATLHFLISFPVHSNGFYFRRMLWSPSHFNFDGRVKKLLSPKWTNPQRKKPCAKNIWNRGNKTQNMCKVCSMLIFLITGFDDSRGYLKDWKLTFYGSSMTPEKIHKKQRCDTTKLFSLFLN